MPVVIVLCGGLLLYVMSKGLKGLEIELRTGSVYDVSFTRTLDSIVVVTHDVIVPVDDSVILVCLSFHPLPSPAAEWPPEIKH